MNPQQDPPDSSSRPNYYPTTPWTEILNARSGQPEAEEGWKILVERYRKPIRAQIEKYLHEEDAENSTAEFIDYEFAFKLIPKADRSEGRLSQ